MKIIKFIFLSLLAAALLSACAKHDFFDEHSITGNIGPMALWDVASAAVSAGSTMGFTVQYYSPVAEIDRSEVWYNVVEKEFRQVSCSWVVSRTFNIGSEISQEKRISQKIKEYPHSRAVWSDVRRAYILTDNFPVSNTLVSFSWSKPDTFDEEKMNDYFGTGYMKFFKDSLERIMKWSDYKNMMLKLELLEDFKQYTDSSPDINAGDNAWIYHFPKDKDDPTPPDKIPVPAEIKNLFEGITFEKLIQGTAGYNVEYKRDYSINAVLRVYDEHGIYAKTESKKIEIN